jgi:hypothetical protein
MKTINLDELLGKTEPALELKVGEKTYQILAMEQMPEERTLRVLDMNAQYEAIREDVNNTIAAIDRDMAAMPDADMARKAPLLARRVSVQASLSRPIRQLIEALAGMEDGTLQPYPLVVVEQVFGEVNSVLFTPEKKPEETNTSIPPTAEVAKTETVAAAPKVVSAPVPVPPASTTTAPAETVSPTVPQPVASPMVTESSKAISTVEEVKPAQS